MLFLRVGREQPTGAPPPGAFRKVLSVHIYPEFGGCIAVCGIDPAPTVSDLHAVGAGGTHFHVELEDPISPQTGLAA